MRSYHPATRATQGTQCYAWPRYRQTQSAVEAKRRQHALECSVAEGSYRLHSSVDSLPWPKTVTTHSGWSLSWSWQAIRTTDPLWTSCQSALSCSLWGHLRRRSLDRQSARPAYCLVFYRQSPVWTSCSACCSLTRQGSNWPSDHLRWFSPSS